MQRFRREPAWNRPFQKKPGMVPGSDNDLRTFIPPGERLAERLHT